MARREYRFSFGPWNIHTGADPFGPPVRKEVAFARKLELVKELGYHAVQFHDDDVVPWGQSQAATTKKIAQVKKMCADEGIAVEFIAPRLWEDPRGRDGGITANDPKVRAWALERSKWAVDIADALDTRNMVLWPAREGTYLRESKDPIAAVEYTIEYLDKILEHHPQIRILGEMKPNEPMDMAYYPTSGHFLALGYRTRDPSRVGVLIESAHAMLAGLEPSDEMGFALAHGKLWGVHLNDQNGLKFDEDKSFGAVNLRRAFNQVDVLERGGYGTNGEYVGFDVKALRTQDDDKALKHLTNSKEIFLALVELSRKIDRKAWQGFIDARDYEGLDLFITKSLMRLK
jgi:xylose isomerase